MFTSWRYFDNLIILTKEERAYLVQCYQIEHVYNKYAIIIFHQKLSNTYVSKHFENYQKILCSWFGIFKETYTPIICEKKFVTTSNLGVVVTVGSKFLWR